MKFSKLVERKEKNNFEKKIGKNIFDHQGDIFMSSQLCNIDTGLTLTLKQIFSFVYSIRIITEHFSILLLR